MARLDGRVALVTGASRGIGAATAKLLASEGARVCVNYNKSEQAARAVVEEIVARGGRALAVQADACDEAQVGAMVARAREALGPVDTLVINASMTFPTCPFVEYLWEAFEKKLVGELKAAFFASKAVVPDMIAKGSGCIVGISSGLSRVPGDGFCAHTTAKSGLDGFMKSLAYELGPKGIRVNVVAPGLTLTDATARLPDQAKEASARTTPLRRNGVPEDIAGAVLMMVSDDARFVTGAYLPVSGGRLMP